MTPILAKVLAVDKQDDQYRAIIKIMLRARLKVVPALDDYVI